MNGGDLGQIAQNIIITFGGPTGGFIVAAALLITCLMVAIGWAGQHRIMHCLGAGVLAWAAAWIIRVAVGWA